MLKERNNTKLIYIEAMRIIACFFVIYNHSSAYHEFLNPGNMQSVRRFAYMLVSAVTKFSVPLFFMISGALLLKKSESIKEVLHKRLPKILIAILFVDSVIYGIICLAEMRSGNRHGISLEFFIRGMLNNDLPGTVSYWFLYLYAAFILVLPILQRIAHGLTGSEILILVGCLAVKRCLIPLLNLVLYMLHKNPIQLYLPIPLLDDTIIFPLIGYYLDQRLDVSKLKKTHVLEIIGSCILGAVLACVLTYYDKEANGSFSQNYIGAFNWLQAASVFILVKYFVEFRFNGHFEGKLGKFIVLCGSLTFGVYLFDPILKWFPMYSIFPIASVSPFREAVKWCLLSMIIGGMITWILKRIPILRKFI